MEDADLTVTVQWKDRSSPCIRVSVSPTCVIPIHKFVDAFVEVLSEEIYPVTTLVWGTRSTSFGIEPYSPMELTYARFVSLAGAAVFKTCADACFDTRVAPSSALPTVARLETVGGGEDDAASVRVWTAVA